MKCCDVGSYLRIVEHVKFLGRVSASIQQDGLLSSRVVGKEAGDVQDLFTDDNPAVILLVVLGDLTSIE